MFLPFGSGWAKLVNYVTSATFFMYGTGAHRPCALRRSLPEQERPYSLRRAEIWAPVAFIFDSLIVYWGGLFHQLAGGRGHAPRGAPLLGLGRTRLEPQYREALHWKAGSLDPGVGASDSSCSSWLGGSLRAGARKSSDSG